MNGSKKMMVAGFLVVIGCGWLAIMWLDWSRLLSFASAGRVEEFLLSRRIKLALSLVTALLVWTTGRAGLSLRDRRLMGAAFAVFFMADIAFYLNNYYVGIGVFSLAQVVFIVRNGAGFTALFADGALSRSALRLYAIAAVVLCVNGILLRLIFVPHSANPMFPMIAGYSFFLCCSLSTGIATRVTASFPSRNSWLIAIGVSMLYLGDLMVGLNIILPRDQSYIISTSLTWFFYLPAITLFALSGYRWHTK